MQSSATDIRWLTLAMTGSESWQHKNMLSRFTQRRMLTRTVSLPNANIHMHHSATVVEVMVWAGCEGPLQLTKSPNFFQSSWAPNLYINHCLATSKQCHGNNSIMSPSEVLSHYWLGNSKGIRPLWNSLQLSFGGRSPTWQKPQKRRQQVMVK